MEILFSQATSSLLLKIKGIFDADFVVEETAAGADLGLNPFADSGLDTNTDRPSGRIGEWTVTTDGTFRGTTLFLCDLKFYISNCQ